jgi:hypothetical protein
MDTKKIVESSVKEVLSEDKDISKPADWSTSFFNKGRAHAKEQEEAKNSVVGKTKKLLGEIKPAHAAAAALAIGAGLGGVALAKKLRAAKKESKVKA